MSIPPRTLAVANDLGERAHISLGGVGYLLKNGVPAEFRPQAVPAPDAQFISSSEHLTMRDSSGFSRVVVNDWRRGGGQVTWLVDDPVSRARFYDSTGADIHEQGLVYCVNDITANVNGTSTNATINALPLLNVGGYLYMGEQGAVNYSALWTAAPSTASSYVGGTDQVISLETDGQYVYGCARIGNPGINRWTVGSTTAASNFYIAGATSNFRRLLFANRRLYALNNVTPTATTAAMFIEITLAGVATTDYTFPVGWTLIDIAARTGGAIDAPIYVMGYTGSTTRLWYWDGTNIHDYVQLPVGFVGQRLRYYQGTLFIQGYVKNPSGNFSSCAYYVTNDTLGFLGYFGLLQTNGDPTPNDSTTEATFNIDAAENFVYFTVSDNTNGKQEIWRYDIISGGLSRYFSLTNGNTFESMVIYQGRPWFTLAAVGLFTSRVTYVTTATLDTSDLHFGQPWAQNLWTNIELTHVKLAAGESIAVSYSIDGGNTYTATDAAGATMTSNTLAAIGRSFTISNATTSVKSQYIRLRFTLTAGTSQLTTPRLVAASVKGIPIDPTGFIATFTVACPNEQEMPNGQPDWQGLSGQERIYQIVNLFETQSITTLIYLAPSATRAKNPTSIAVKVQDYKVNYLPPNVRASPPGNIEGDVTFSVRQVV